MGNKNKQNDEDMTVSITDMNDVTTTCAIQTIITVNELDYIILLPMDEKGKTDPENFWIYGYSENPEDVNEEPKLRYLEDDAEYEMVEDAYYDYLENSEFDEITYE